MSAFEYQWNQTIDVGTAGLLSKQWTSIRHILSLLVTANAAYMLRHMLPYDGRLVRPILPYSWACYYDSMCRISLEYGLGYRLLITPHYMGHSPGTFSLCIAFQWRLTHWGWDKMAAIFQTIYWKAFSWMKMYKFQLIFQWSFLMGPMNNIPVLVQIIAWRRPGGKPLSESVMLILLTHICVTPPEWVKASHLIHRSSFCSKAYSG